MCANDEKLLFFILFFMILGACLILVLLITEYVSLNKKHNVLKKEVECIQKEQKRLIKIGYKDSEKIHNCHLCGHEVYIVTIMDNYYICCPNCFMRSGFWSSKNMLIKYWNKEVSFEPDDINKMEV